MTAASRSVQAVVLATGINGLGATRSLGAAGIPHALLYVGAGNNARHSRYPRLRRQLPHDVSDTELLRMLAEFAGSGAAVIACSDAHSDFLARQRETLEASGLQVVCPPGNVSEVLNDKALELELMQQGGVTLPPSVITLPPSAKALMEQIAFPIILKPRSYRYANYIRTKNVIARDRAELDTFYAEQHGRLDGFVAQQVIAGADDALWVCNCLFGAEGELLQAFTFQRLRTSPPHFGVTSFAVGRHNADIKRACSAIGRQLAYAGPAMIEFKYDASTRQYCYIETNPRIGMCNILDTRSGVNNVAAAVRLARGEPTGVPVAHSADPGELPQRDGVYFLNFHGDMESRLSDGEQFPAIVWSYLRTLPAPHAWAFFSWADPWPWMRTVGQQVVQTTTRLVRRAQRARLAAGAGD